MTTIEILHFPGCPNGRPAIDAVNAIVDGLDREIEVIETIVDPEDVERIRFLGSPTIRVNGRDVEPDAERRTHFGYSCRTYDTRAGIVGVPLVEWIRTAIQEAHGPTPFMQRGKGCHCSSECWCRSGWRRRVRWLWPARHIAM